MIPCLPYSYFFSRYIVSSVLSVLGKCLINGFAPPPNKVITG